MRFELGQRIIDKIRGKRSTFIYSYKNGNKLIYFNEDGCTINPIFKINGLEINFHGKNSTVIIHSSNKFVDCKLNIGDENLVIIKEDKYEYAYKHFSIVYPMATKSRLVIGKSTTILDSYFYLHDEPNTVVSIGDDCLFSFNNIIWPSDGHSIIDHEGNVLNSGENIKIGNHVWIGMDCKILKGSFVPNDSVVGASSIFTSGSNPLTERLLEGGVFAGMPAKLIRKNISWDRKSPYQYKINKGDCN